MKELNNQIEQMISDFQNRQNELKNEIENLKKSTDTIKESMLKEYNKVFEYFKTELPYIMNVFAAIDDSYSNISAYKRLEYFSVVSSYRETQSSAINVDVHGRYIAIIFNNISYKLNGNRFEFYSQFRDNEEDKDKEVLIKYFYSGNFKEEVMYHLRMIIERKIKKYEKTIESHKRILENSEPIMKEDSNWQDYIMYLLKWSSEHAGNEFAGMSPACYDEWLDNECCEEE